MRIGFHRTDSLFQLGKSEQGLASSLERISTGRRITRAADDAAGLFIADQLGAQARGMGQAIRNSNDAVSILQVAEGALGGTHALLQGIREKALQAANASQSPESRAAIQADITEARKALDDIAGNTGFNGQKLLTGTFSDRRFQIGANSGETLSLSIDAATSGFLGDREHGTVADMDVTTQEGAEAAIIIADAALEQVARSRSQLGATQNQVTASTANLFSGKIQAQAAESTIRDVDLAEESMNLDRMKALRKAGLFARAQANISRENVLSLLGGTPEKQR